jgi:hypothetical protein
MGKAQADNSSFRKVGQFYFFLTSIHRSTELRTWFQNRYHFIGHTHYHPGKLFYKNDYRKRQSKCRMYHCYTL